jgi:hypothetical protein
LGVVAPASRKRWENEIPESKERQTRCFFLSKVRCAAKKPRKTHIVEAGECLNFGSEKHEKPRFSSVFASRSI